MPIISNFPALGGDEFEWVTCTYTINMHPYVMMGAVNENDNLVFKDFSTYGWPAKNSTFQALKNSFFVLQGVTVVTSGGIEFLGGNGAISLGVARITGDFTIAG